MRAPHWGHNNPYCVAVRLTMALREPPKHGPDSTTVTLMFPEEEDKGEESGYNLCISHFFSVIATSRLTKWEEATGFPLFQQQLAQMFRVFIHLFLKFTIHFMQHFNRTINESRCYLSMQPLDNNNWMCRPIAVIHPQAHTHPGRRAGSVTALA